MILLGLHVLWFLFLFGVALCFAGWLIFVWSVRTGQYSNPDEVADRMLEAELGYRVSGTGSGTSSPTSAADESEEDEA